LKHYVYVLRSIPTGRYYIGKTSDPVRQLHERNSKEGPFASSFQPWELIVLEEFDDDSGAAQRQAFLKSRAGIQERKLLIDRAQTARLAERP